MCLNTHKLLLHRRLHPDIRHTAKLHIANIASGSIHPKRRQNLILIRPEIRCRQSQSPTDLPSVNDPSIKEIRITQHIRRLLHLPTKNTLPDQRTGDFPIPIHLLRKHLHRKTILLSHTLQKIRIPGSVMPKSEIRPNHQTGRFQPLYQQFSDKIFSFHTHHLLIKRTLDQPVQIRLLQHPAALIICQ